MIDEKLASHFHRIRARIEAELKPPSLVMVTSAKSDDGAGLTAFGLADCLAAAGHRTALVDATGKTVTAIDDRLSSERAGDFPVYVVPWDDASSSRPLEALESFFARELRDTFDYIIVDAPPIARHNPTSALASIVDAVIMTVRMARKPCTADEFMVRSFNAIGAYVLGVIAVDTVSIAHFDEAGAKRQIGARPHRRGVQPANRATGQIQVLLREAH